MRLAEPRRWKKTAAPAFAIDPLYDDSDVEDVEEDSADENDES